MLLSTLLATPLAKDVAVTGLTLDSRKVQSGDVFFALPGTKADGNTYIANAIDAGATAVVSTTKADGFENNDAVPAIHIQSLRNELGKIATRFYDYRAEEQKLIAVTGTNGKTSVCCIIQQMLTLLGCTSGYIGTLGYGCDGVDNSLCGLTTPDIFTSYRYLHDLKQKGCGVVAIEASSHALDQNRLDGLFFDYGVFTNLSRDHFDYHKSFEAYFTAKKKLFAQCHKAVVNIDDEFGRRLVTELSALPNIEVSCYSATAEYSDDGSDCTYVCDVQTKLDGTTFTLCRNRQKIACRTALIGGFSVSNILAACTVIADMGYSLQELSRIIPQVKTPPGRLEKIHEHPAICIDYAHTPDALTAVLTNLRHMTAGNLLVVFGCGGDRDTGKRAEMGQAAGLVADCVFLTSDNPRSEDPQQIITAILQGVDRTGVDCVVEPDRAKAIELAINTLETEDCLLIAGKGHETGQIIGDSVFPFSDHVVVDQLVKAS